MNIGGFEIELIRKNIKNINLSVHPDGHVSVSAPHFVPIEKIEAFVVSKTDWIIYQKEKIGTVRENPEEYLAGDTVRVFSNKLTLVLDPDARRGSVLVKDDTLILGDRGGSTREEREHYINEWLREQLRCEIEYLLPIWEERCGLYPSEWQIKNMKTRWGSCNTKTGKIWFSLQLAKEPPECLEYVILHELAHLREPNHSKRFYAILDEYMPDWRVQKQKLNRR